MKIHFNTIHKITYWIIVVWFRNVPNAVTISIAWINQVEDWIRDNGNIWTIKHIKMCRQLVMSHLSDKPQMAVQQIIGINRSNGLPKCLNSMHPLIESRNRDDLRFVFTLLSISRLIPGWVEPDLRTITTPSNPNLETINKIIDYTPIFLKENNWEGKLPGLFKQEDLKYSSKSGPNGMAVMSALTDIISMPEWLQNLFEELNIRFVFKEYKKLLSPNRVWKFHLIVKHWGIISYDKRPFKMPKDPKDPYSFFNDLTIIQRSELLLKDPSLIKNADILTPRKLSVVKDPEAKSRIIAIFDYWSQNWLRQIHDVQFSFLRGLPQDRTYTQDPSYSGKIDGHMLYSFDLSAATDRFPLILQKGIMEKMFDSKIANAWAKILVDTPFYVPWTNSNVKYEAGQPMGAYSSWSTFTISHHIVLQYIHWELGIKDKLYYIILGDDIMIYHDDVADMYQIIMSQLDVGISIPKSCISEDMYEFAKRIFFKGTEITGIQLVGLYNNVNKYHLIYQMVFDLVKVRGYYPAQYQTIDQIIYCLNKLLGKEERRCKNIQSRVRLLHAFNTYINFEDSSKLIQEFKHLYPQCGGQFDIPDLYLNNLVYLACEKSMQKINQQYIGYIENLLKVQDKFAIGLSDQDDIWTSPVYYVSRMPVIQALGNLANSISKSRNLESLKELVSAVAFPGGEALDFRGSIVLINSQAKLAKITLNMFEHCIVKETLTNMPEPNLGGLVLWQITNDSRMIDKTIKKDHGLIPPQPPVSTPKIDPYNVSSPFDWF